MLIIISDISHAQIIPSRIILPQQQKIIEQEKINREINEFKEWEKKAKKDIQEPMPSSLPESGNCFYINNIVVTGNTVLSKYEILKVLSVYHNTCISASKITTLIQKINSLYQAKGYITTQVYVKEQNLRYGTLILSVLEGKVEDVRFGSNSRSEKVTRYFTAPLQKGSVLNIKSLDQTTDNLSALPSYNYITTVDAGSKPGFSKIYINGKKSSPIHPSVETDTFGQEYTGEERYSIGSAFDNLLKLGDSINIKYTSTYNREFDGKFSRTLIGSLSIPLQWSKFGVNSSYLNYLTTITTGSGTLLKSKGDVFNNSFFINALLFRDKTVKTMAFYNLNLLNKKSYINDTLIPVQSGNFTNIELGIINNLYTPYGGFYHKLTYTRGITAFDAKEDSPNTAFHAQFSSVRLYGLYSVKADKIFRGRLPFTFQNTIDGQYAWEDVYSQNQFVLGGLYSVRGYKDLNVFGSMGILMRNDIDFALKDYIMPRTPLAKLLTNGGKGGLTLGAFYDIGITNSHAKDSKTTGSLSGIGYKLGYTSQYFYTNLIVAYALDYPDELDAHIQKNKGRIIYFTMKGSW